MDWTAPIPLKFAEHTSPENRMLALLGHLDLRVYRGVAYLEVGAGSLTTARRVNQIPRSFSGCMGSIGRFVEAAMCEIAFGGEHANDKPVNAVFANFAVLWPMALALDMAGPAPLPIRIGNNVVISQGAQILSGVCIADGAVIGAGAIVTRDIAAFSIVGGVPARKIRDRFSDTEQQAIARVRWWDFDPAYLGANFAQVQELAASPLPHIYRPDRPRYVVRLIESVGGGCEVIGWIGDDGAERPLAEAPEKARNYAQQLGAADTLWLADPWS